MDYDNNRDRFSNGFDSGVIVDGKVIEDEKTKELVIVDDDGVAFSIQEALKTLVGKNVRITCISFEAMDDIMKMVSGHQKN